MGRQAEELSGFGIPTPSSTVLPRTAFFGGWFFWVSDENPGQAREDGKLGQGWDPPTGADHQPTAQRGVEGQEVRVLFLSSLLSKRCGRPGPVPGCPLCPLQRKRILFCILLWDHLRSAKLILSHVQF